MWGDTLARHNNGAGARDDAPPRGCDLAPTGSELRRAYPHATGRVAVFVHGLCETDDAWMLGGARHVPYGFRLQAELGYTPLYVRYNSGLHISDNGRRLARLLDGIAEQWPTEIHELALIGHSMGGLVARSACHYAEDSSWREPVRHVFTLRRPPPRGPTCARRQRRHPTSSRGFPRRARCGQAAEDPQCRNQGPAATAT